MVERGAFYYGDQQIHYEVVRKETVKPKSDSSIIVKRLPSKTPSRKILIKVHPDQRVVVTAPYDASTEMIYAATIKRAGWIWQSLQDFAKQTEQVLPKHYISGEPQFYLGRRYVLKVLIDADVAMTNSTVKLSRGKLNVTLASSDLKAQDKAALIKNLVDHWYQDKAQAIFDERLSAVLPKATWVTDKPAFRLLAMKKQWGSCSTKSNLILNPHLIKAPKECIDYVILHELCHISEHNHSEHFWRLLTQVMPNWRVVKAKLDGMAEFYLNE